MLYRQPATELSEKRVILFQVIIRLWHFQQTLSANQVLTFDEGFQAGATIPGIEEGDEVLQDAIVTVR